MDAFMTSWRAQGAPWDAWMAEVEAARTAFARLIHADPGEIAVVSCASEGAYQVISSLSFSERARIVTSDLEFPSIAHVFAGASARGAAGEVLPAPDGQLRLEDYLSARLEDAALVSVPLAVYANGHRPPVQEIAAAAKQRGARVFIDAYQGAGVLPIDVRTLPCDYLVAGSLKYLLGAPGLAFLYVRQGSMPEGHPPYSGWFGRVAPFAFTPRTLDYADGARRFQGGTPAIPAAYAAAAGLSLIAELDQAQVLAHVLSLGDWLQAELLERGVRLTSPRDRSLRGPQVAVRAEDAPRLAEFLKERGVIVSPRGHSVRISMHYYNLREDLERARDGIFAYEARYGL